jgi:zinc D-Ala-D-Ala carboxypeptidase
MRLQKKSHKVAILTVFGLLLVIIATVACWWFLAPKASTPQVKAHANARSKEQTPKKPAVPSFNKSLYSTTDPASLWIVVNKAHRLSPVDYSPTDLSYAPNGVLVSGRILPDLNALISAAATQGVTLPIVSGFRSYGNQVTLYNKYVAQYGQATTDTISARPGHSEHQTGLAVDLGTVTNPGCSLNPCFTDTAEGQWITAHAHEYGFIVRYTKENSAVTGYDPEGWHIRYIGHELADELTKENITTLETFFKITGGTTYID